ncbi:hypothetical protein EDE15_4194 [Edaphobacter aggregans]|uniref:Uncharacterized protein n=1 Tax=Edaphobacter aggregans TaxID=570835 RepID=A0A428MNX1_9BACT|nr:hypothetical protein [Edaphobacter aggregans]RSL18604.1 hypothetical protein EDE15_4194 [Edaphobacter aggregans]
MRTASQLAVYETFENVYGRKSTMDELIAEIRPFTQQSVLWVCAVIVTGLQLWNKVDFQPADVYKSLLSLYFEADLHIRFIAGYWSSNPRRVLFHRRQVLLIAKIAILHCSGGTDARLHAERFGSILLKANDQFDYGLLTDLANAGRPVAEREEFSKIIAEMIAVGEDASPEITQLITRSHLMLTRFTDELRQDPDFVDVAGEYQKETGLTLEEYQSMIFGTHARFGEELSKALYREPGTLPLKEANFSPTAIEPTKVSKFLDLLAANPTRMARELRVKDNGPNDFTIFRRFPLVQQFYNLHQTTAWCGYLMIDNLFFLEKVLTGPYWHASAHHGLKLRKFWGAVFEKYVNELMRCACAGTQARFIPDPKPSGRPDMQICDGIVVSGDSIVLMEYKSSMFRADTKYSGDHLALTAEIEKKLVEDKESSGRKGVLQLVEATQTLFGVNASKVTPEIDLTEIKHVYLYIVTLDSIGGTIGMPAFLNTFLDEHLDRNAFPPRQIRPIFCSGIESLEMVTGFFAKSTLPEILEKWLDSNPSLTAPLQAIDLSGLCWRENDWLHAEWISIYKNMVKILFPKENPDLVVADGIRRSRR